MPAKGHPLLRFALFCGIGCGLAEISKAQFLEPPEKNLFGDEFVKTIDIRNNGGIVLNGRPRNSEVNQAYENLLMFQDGRQLRGRMESVTREEIVWRRADFSEPLHLRREDVHRVFLTPAPAETNRYLLNGGQIIVMDASGRRTVRNVGSGSVIPATVKLGGEDWLHGQVTSSDGQNFTLRTDDKGASITVPRSEIDWMYFDWNTARGGGFDGSIAGMDDWLAAAPSATVSKDGILTIPQGNEWFGRTLPQPKFFEISMEISADTEQGSHLWLQPFNPSPNAFGTGTLDVEFGPKQLAVRRFVNNMDQKEIPISESSPPDARGMVQYRVFYDSETHRLVIFRNGRNVADWKPDPPKPEDAPVNPLTPQTTDYVMRMSNRSLASSITISEIMKSLASSGAGLGSSCIPSLISTASHWRFTAHYLLQRARAQNPRITGISIAGARRLSPDGNDRSSALKLRRFRVSPWDGVLPRNDEGPLAEDQLTTGAGLAISGQLESITDKDITLAQRTTPKAVGMLLRLPNSARSPIDLVAKADLGLIGELSASSVKIADGKVHLRTAFAEDLVFPATALTSINFSPLAPSAFANSDVLVFKNGDELPGSLLSASQGGLRWKLATGQEVEIEPKHLAGVRLAASREAKPVFTEALVELRNGDRLRGEIVSFDETRLGLKHPLLGALSMETPRLWKVFPHSTAGIRDGAEDPKSWINPDLRAGPMYYRAPSLARKKPDAEQSWLYFDGCYLPRQTRRQNGEVEQSLLSARVPAQDGGLFELRAEITATGDNPPNGMFAIGGKPNPSGAVSSVFVNFSYAEMYVNIINGQGQKSRQVPFGAKLGKISTRLSLRIFVDSILGTVDIMLDGVLLARVGQQTDERAPGISEIVNVGGIVYDGHPMVISNVWVGPWDGELPRGEAVPSTTLANGDATACVPSLLKGGSYHMDTDVGPIDVPASAMSAISFGGEFSPQRSAVRLRLADGSVLHLASFACRERTLTGRSELFGEVRLPLDAIREVVIDPPLIRETKGPAPKKPVQTADAAGPEKPIEKK